MTKFLPTEQAQIPGGVERKPEPTAPEPSKPESLTSGPSIESTEPLPPSQQVVQTPEKEPGLTTPPDQGPFKTLQSEGPQFSIERQSKSSLPDTRTPEGAALLEEEVRSGNQ